ncbi:5-methyltetrahydrofolate--homocysteine methyltransferase [Bacillus pakistanensis]|uniref:Methionine synthase n=1 Tax=Rossellomorea pakistanensis TaxID=992288 RepID=A0ABS2N885_9BACI|nr:methionine synthase [Bacillus pakistanensis]MBM7584034.1 5-methyltetrahydrofolate--homocysteine methyltransferase [Bacillus pakistanensis]
MATTLFEEQLKKKIIVLDGAMGTMLQQANLTFDDFGGEEFEGCNEYLVLTAPDVIYNIHLEYLKAGADVIETNTFGATPIVLDEYDLGEKAYEINKVAAEIARKAVTELSSPEWPRFVAGAMGPTTKTLSVTGGVEFDELADHYRVQAEGLLAGGVDVLLLETSQDALNVKAANLGIRAAFKKAGFEIPILLSGTIEPMGTTLAGQNIEAFYLSLEHLNPLVVGLNCATGPEFMRDHIRSLSDIATAYVSCYPNAGLPDEEGNYNETPESLSTKMSGFVEKGWLNLVGGCCGTTPAHIRAIADIVKGFEPRTPKYSHPHAVSGIEPFVYEDADRRPILVGERTNVIGSRKFKRLIAEGKIEEASEIARAQVKNGAQVIDICLADPDRDEVEDMNAFIQQVVNKVKVPLVIDSTDEEVIERALKFTQGKVIINSINLEDGEERFEKIVQLLKQYGAAVVVGTIDEQGMGVTADRKVEIALRSHKLLTEKYQIPSEDIIFDPLVFPVGTGDQQYIGSAQATIEGIKRIKKELPECPHILGISNVSFGLPPVGREILNAVYLYHCTKAGLDYAIVNTEKLERFASIPADEVALAESLLFHTTDETLAKFTDFYRGKKKEVKVPVNTMTLSERLAHYIVEGTKEGLIQDLDTALKEYENPLAIINGPLMDGMTEVGRLFNDNQLIVAEVLQSAEVMKASVAYLEPHMEQTQSSSTKGKIILATVKGDVHDIGKNLVDIILSNNGYDVIDLGIKVTPQQLIEIIRKESPDIVGLSGLLVKSAQQMVITAQDLKQSDIHVPLVVGGAALTRKFTSGKIAREYEGLVLYAKDAMDGLSIMNGIQDKETRLKWEEESKQTLSEPRDADVLSTISQGTALATKVRSSVAKDVRVFIPPDLESHIIKEYSVDHIKPYINLQMLLGHHLGIKGKISRLLVEGDKRTIGLKQTIDDLFQKAKKEGILQASALYQFFPAQSEGDDVIIYHPKDLSKEIERFHFPRQAKSPYLCLADYIRSVDSGEMDYVGFFAVTAGHKIREWAKELKAEGSFLESHAIQALALETAEGLAERVHEVMRSWWGFPDPIDFTMQDRFRTKYRGQRFSFGYPACPDLEDQEKLFKLLQPEKIGIKLTDGFMMEPEASVTAMVFAHPEARYFNVL